MVAGAGRDLAGGGRCSVARFLGFAMEEKRESCVTASASADEPPLLRSRRRSCRAHTPCSSQGRPRELRATAPSPGPAAYRSSAPAPAPSTSSQRGLDAVGSHSPWRGRTSAAAAPSRLGAAAAVPRAKHASPVQRGPTAASSARPRPPPSSAPPDFTSREDRGECRGNWERRRKQGNTE
ncbi:unnamed protein product [Urochloa humidicola]